MNGMANLKEWELAQHYSFTMTVLGRLGRQKMSL